jgi:hypothetical protein
MIKKRANGAVVISSGLEMVCKMTAKIATARSRLGMKFRQLGGTRSSKMKQPGSVPCTVPGRIQSLLKMVTARG